MSTWDVIDEYVRTRACQPVITGWVGGALALLAAGMATSPGRLAVKRNPPPTFQRMAAVPPAAHPSTAKACKPRSNLSKSLYLFRLAIPSWPCRELGIIAVMTVLMLLRTAANVVLARLTGGIVRSVIRCDASALFRSAFLYMLASIPASFTCQSIEYIGEALKLRFRENITRSIVSRYLAPRVFFRLAGLHIVEHIDQRIPADVAHFSKEAALVMHSVVDPLCEAAAFTVIMGLRAGWRSPALLWAYLSGFIGIAYTQSPNMDWMTIKMAEAEAAYGAAHQQVLANAEELCMTDGHGPAQEEFARLNRVVAERANIDSYAIAKYSLMETAYTKYGTWVVGSLICGVALFGETARSDATLSDTSDFTGRFAETAYVCEILARAIGCFFWNIKHLILINSYAKRLYTLIQGIEVAEYEANRHRLTDDMAVVAAAAAEALGDAGDGASSGVIERGEHIEFVDVPLRLPNGEVLCASLSFHVRPGMNLLIMGPNGCGKSSTFRLLGELWPLRGGRLVKPEQEQLYYVPQRPYMYDGTLFEQVIYPLKRKDVSVGEAELFEYLEMAGLGGILSRPKVSWDARLSWTGDFLSAGEKQRLAMARLFFHRPRFAILDECSSSVDLDVEAALYTRCRELGITVITIAHRRSVWQYHSHILHFDGNGGYMFSPLRFADGGSTLVLPRVITASDEAVVGTEVVLHVSQRWEDEIESAQVAESV